MKIFIDQHLSALTHYPSMILKHIVVIIQTSIFRTY